MPQIQSQSEYQQIMQPAGQQKVPVVFHVSDELMPDERTINQLEKVASDPHIFHHISALTDVHQKPGRKNPSGSVVATKGHILPQLTDTAPNCGMRMMKTPFSTEDLNKKQIDDLFNELVKVIPTKTYFGTPVDYKTILEVSKRGSAALLEHFNKDLSETEHTFMRGNAFGEEKITNEKLFEAIPRLFFQIAKYRLGILGAAGNHFLDLMRITDILDEEKAGKMGIKKNQYVFLMHTGSGLFGQYCSYFYTPKIKEHTSQRIVLKIAQNLFKNKNADWFKKLKKDLNNFKTKEEFFAIKENSELAKNFIAANRAAANHGYANRVLSQIKLEKAMEKVLKKKIEMPLVYDMTHVSIQKENHFSENVWVHRSNASRAFGPARLENDSPYKEIGEPVFTPSSMSTPAFLGTATDDNEKTFYSAAHGTGKSKTKTSKVPEDKAALHEKMKSRGVKLYNAASKNIVDQDAGHYKSAEAAIKGMQANGIINPVAKMMPVAVLMA